MPSSYKRVYSDWKPSSALEKTDVMGTMEAIAGMIPRNKFPDEILESLLFFLFGFQALFLPFRTSRHYENLV